jgi:hypothetical protein
MSFPNANVVNIQSSNLYDIGGDQINIQINQAQAAGMMQS